jgi:hypothetical protein
MNSVSYEETRLPPTNKSINFQFLSYTDEDEILARILLQLHSESIKQESDDDEREDNSFSQKSQHKTQHIGKEHRLSGSCAEHR